MENDKSIMLQKQVRNNSEDLQKEFLDMKNWEEQMSKADSEIRNAGGNPILPPIRKKKKSTKEIQKSQNKINDTKSKRIKSSDYAAWDNFDVDKACEAVDKDNESEDAGEESLSKEEFERNHAEATKHKVEGNVFVQKQQWAKAIACYNDAIKVFPYDAVFFANRALCHLKIDNLHSAEADCTAAVQLDEFYIKAYHRRATARIELKQYKEAAEDIKRVLKLEPSNKEAQSMLVRVNKLIDNAKPLIISSTREEPEDPEIEKKIGQKLSWNESSVGNKKKKDPEELKVISVKKSIAEKHSSSIQNVEKKVVEPVKKVVKIEINDVDSEKSLKDEVNSRIPEWLPELQEDVGIVDVITKQPHQRSKKPLRTVPIEPIEFGVKKQEAKDLHVESSKSELESRGKPEDPSVRLAAVEAETENVPEAPKTAVQFLLTWRKNKSTDFRYEYFKRIPAERIPTLFQDSMESNTFSEIINVLRLEFMRRKEPVFDYLRYLSEVKRFRTLTMFMTNTDKENLRKLFEYAEKVEEQSNNVVKNLCTKYEL